MSQPPSQPYSGQPYPGEPYPGQPGSGAGAGYPPPGQPSYPPPSYPQQGQSAYPPPPSYPQQGQPSYPPPSYPQQGQPSYPQQGQQPCYPQQGPEGFAQPYPQQGGFGQPPQKKSPVLKIVLISLAIVMVLCVGGGVVAFLAAKDKVGDVVEAANTTVVAPDTLMGRKKVTDPELAGQMDSLEQEMARVPGATGSVGAIYGDPLKQDLVMIAAASSITGTPQGKFDEFVSGLQQGGFKSTDMKDTDPGPLGGIAQCGSSKPSGIPMNVCVWSDNGSIGMIAMMFKDVSALEKEFIAMRGQIEQRS